MFSFWMIVGTTAFVTSLMNFIAPIRSRIGRFESDRRVVSRAFWLEQQDRPMEPAPVLPGSAYPCAALFRSEPANPRLAAFLIFDPSLARGDASGLRRLTDLSTRRYFLPPTSRSR